MFGTVVDILGQKICLIGCSLILLSYNEDFRKMELIPCQKKLVKMKKKSVAIFSERLHFFVSPGRYSLVWILVSFFV